MSGRQQAGCLKSFEVVFRVEDLKGPWGFVRKIPFFVSTRASPKYLRPRKRGLGRVRSIHPRFRVGPAGSLGGSGRGPQSRAPRPPRKVSPAPLEPARTPSGVRNLTWPSRTRRHDSRSSSLHRRSFA